MSRTSHADSAVRACETWLADHFRESDAVPRVVSHSGVPERSIKRRTGLTPSLYRLMFSTIAA